MFGRLFLKTFVAGLLLFFPHLAIADELRGLWVDAFGPGFLNKKQVKELAHDCRKYNFNSVFVQMRKRGDAFYFPQSPNPDPRNHNLATNFDALAEIIHECHDKAPRIQVHCWLTGYLIWAWKNPPAEKNHLFAVHPEYLMKDSIGEMYFSEGYYLDPGNPDANLALLNTAKDIVSRYDVDGLHWDYLRYPADDSGYSAVAIKRYQDEYSTKEIPKPADVRFNDWRRRQVTDFVRWSSAELLSIKPQLVISASVFANFKDAYGIHFQDWAAWNRGGIIDATVPMNFSPDNQHIFIPRANFARTNEWNRTVWMGQGSYMMSPQNTLKQLEFCRSNGFGGVVIFSYRKPSKESTVGKKESMQENQKTALTFLNENFQPKWEAAPVLPWKRNPNKGIIKGTVNGSDGKPVYNATVKLLDLPEQMQRTEPHGCFSFFEVVPGEHQIEISFGRGNLARKKVLVKSGQVAHVKF